MKVDFKKEFIYTANPEAPSCHASTLVKMSDGSIGAAWFGGKGEGEDDVDIWFARRVGSKWSKPMRISAARDIPHWNPVLFMRENGTACLYFKVGKKIAVWKTYFVLSNDCGKSWSEPKELVEGDESGGRGPVKNKPIRLSDGTVIAPASSEVNRDWKVFADVSKDDGASFERSNFVERPMRNGKIVLMIQPTLWESESGNVHMLVRTNRKYIYRSDSVDGGKSWCAAYKTNLFNNNSGIDIVKTDNGRLFLICNPVKENWGERTPLTVISSLDGGKTWGEGFVLECDKGEYSYPSIIADGDELLMTYTWNRKTVCFASAKIY